MTGATWNLGGAKHMLSVFPIVFVCLYYIGLLVVYIRIIHLCKLTRVLIDSGLCSSRFPVEIWNAPIAEPQRGQEMLTMALKEQVFAIFAPAAKE